MNYFRFFKYFYVLLPLAIFSNSSLGLDIQVNGIYGYDLNSTPSVVKQSGVKHEKDIYDVGCNFTHCGVEQLFKFQSGKTQAGSFFALEVGLLATKGAGKTIHIGKVDDLKGVPRNQTILDELPNKGSPQANWKQNSSVLRKKIREGYSIKDVSKHRPNSSPDPTALRPGRTVGQSFLGAERNLLKNKGVKAK